MKGVKDTQKMLTVHDIVQAVWHTKIGTFGNVRAIIRELFLPKESVDDAVLDAVIDREAKLLNYSIGLTTQLYADAKA